MISFISVENAVGFLKAVWFSLITNIAVFLWLYDSRLGFEPKEYLSGD